MSLPVLPSAQSLTPAEVGEYGAQVVAWAEQTDDVAQVREAASKWAAITEYVRRTSREGVAEAEAALRRIEMRLACLMPSASETNGRPLPHDVKAIDHHDRHDFRLMAENRDIVERVIASSTDAEPPSRRKVLTAIRDHKRAGERAEDRQWAADLRQQAGSDPGEDRRRQQIRMDVREAITAVDQLTAKWTADDVRWGIDTSIEHVRDDLRRGLSQAAHSLQELIR